MKRTGRGLLPVIVAFALIIAGIVFFILAGSSPTAVAADFMSALAKGDAKKLTDLSYFEKVSSDEARKKWELTLARTRYYRFMWSIRSTVESTPETAAVSLEVYRTADSPATYGENYALPMLKVNGNWKVDVQGIPRDMFPALPR